MRCNLLRRFAIRLQKNVAGQKRGFEYESMVVGQSGPTTLYFIHLQRLGGETNLVSRAALTRGETGEVQVASSATSGSAIHR
jgi:hypothetical protein